MKVTAFGDQALTYTIQFYIIHMYIIPYDLHEYWRKYIGLHQLRSEW